MTLSLRALLHYTNDSVAIQFCHSHPDYTLAEAEQLFNDLLAWFWLSYQRKKNNKPTYLFGPLLSLDEMWHTFILNTRDYVDFSMNYFGEYHHHEPEPPGFEYQLTEEELSDYLEDCFLYIGSQWVTRRFSAALII